MCANRRTECSRRLPRSQCSLTLGQNVNSFHLLQTGKGHTLHLLDINAFSMLTARVAMEHLRHEFPLESMEAGSGVVPAWVIMNQELAGLP